MHSADVSAREQFAFSEEQVRQILTELVQKDGSEVYRDFPAADLKVLKKEENRKGKPQKGDDEEKISDELKEILD